MSGEPNGTSAAADCMLQDLDYALPQELIAQEPAARREDARLLVLDRSAGLLRDRRIADWPALLRAGDLLVLNNTKVLPAKFLARRNSGGRLEGLFLAEEGKGRWRVMLQKSARLKAGEQLDLGGSLAADGLTESIGEGLGDERLRQPVSLRLLELLGEGQWSVEVCPLRSATEILESLGLTPLPHYIERKSDGPQTDQADRSRYQTVYAQVPGALAAPTAGLHLSEALLEEIRNRGVETVYVTLHVGLGTFRPITAPSLSDHVMHAEQCIVSDEAAIAVNRCRMRGGRVTAVGTTSVRALETAAAVLEGQEGLRSYCGPTDLFIRPPYRFRLVDSLLTNFHLPRSTLLALVMSFAGVDTIRRAYAHAVESRYRFYSYGDAMFIH